LIPVNKSILVMAIIAVLAIGGALTYKTLQSSDQTDTKQETDQPETPEETETTTEEPDTTVSTEPEETTTEPEETDPQEQEDPEEQGETNPDPQPVMLNITHEYRHFGFMHPEHLEEMTDLGIYWQRPHPGPFVWGLIEKEQGSYDWSEVDAEVQRSQEYQINIIATIWPFADWDQEVCNTRLSSMETKMFREIGEYRGKPCDMEVYSAFVSAVVERYDGDGVDDMPGLTMPIKYWEVSNEPSMQEDLVFFTGTPEEYHEILETTYNAVKQADPNAIVVQGGMSGLHGDSTDFWDSVLADGGADYFDIANIHSIGQSSENLMASEYRDYLASFEIEKPFWVTEAQYGNKMEKDQPTGEEWAFFITKSYVRAYSGGAEKIFYVGLEESPAVESTWVIGREGPQEMYYAFDTLVDKLDGWITVEQIEDDLYLFTGEKTVYVCWGTLPDLTGTVTVTYWDGATQSIDISSLEIKDEPVYIENQ